MDMQNALISTGREFGLEIEKDAIYPETGKVWEWKVDGQYFSREDWAAKFLTKRITEKTTSIRTINRKRGNVPDICGSEEYLIAHSGDDWGCRAQRRGCFTMLCSNCPIAEKMQADRDGLKLIYAE
jgi:hypothetical protein